MCNLLHSSLDNLRVRGDTTNLLFYSLDGILPIEYYNKIRETEAVSPVSPQDYYDSWWPDCNKTSDCPKHDPAYECYRGSCCPLGCCYCNWYLRGLRSSV